MEKVYLFGADGFVEAFLHLTDGDAEVFGYLAGGFFAEVLGDVDLFRVFPLGEHRYIRLLSLELFPDGDRDVVSEFLRDELDQLVFFRLCWHSRYGAWVFLPYCFYVTPTSFSRVFHCCFLRSVTTISMISSLSAS